MDEHQEVNTEWQILAAWNDPPSPPDGYRIEVERSSHLGVIIAYRFVREEKRAA